MKYLMKLESFIKTYENFFKSPEDWKVGDIVVALRDIHAGGSSWINKDEKYVIVDINPGNKKFSQPDRIYVKPIDVPANLLNNVDFPTLGRPMIAIEVNLGFSDITQLFHNALLICPIWFMTHVQP